MRSFPLVSMVLLLALPALAESGQSAGDDVVILSVAPRDPNVRLELLLASPAAPSDKAARHGNSGASGSAPGQADADNAPPSRGQLVAFEVKPGL